jgi:hypothetical protein
MPATKIRLGHKDKRLCRFCGRGRPEVTFKQVTHALPEAIGNKSIIVYYECDSCNQKFGAGIETEFGKWSKPLRTFYQIAGKDGVPTLKREGERGWRIELKRDGFIFQQHVDNPIVKFDQAAKRLTVEVPVDAHVPIGVFKTFVKMALSLMPEDEIENVRYMLRWLQENSHTRPFHPEMARVWYTFTPGPRPFEGITTLLLLRKDGVKDVPYCTFIIAVGNECYQIFVPSPEKDSALKGTTINMPLLPTPYQGKNNQYGPSTAPLFYDLRSTDVVRGEKIKRGFHMEMRDPSGTQEEG